MAQLDSRPATSIVMAFSVAMHKLMNAANALEAQLDSHPAKKIVLVHRAALHS
jgi:hypothetical protein